MQPSDPHPHLTLFLTVWAAFGPLAGIFFGHFLSRSWQREQWIRDKRNEEFRELLGTLTNSFAAICRLHAPLKALSPEDERELNDVKANALITIKDRIFIASDVKRLDIYKIWTKAAGEFEDDYVYIAFSEKYALINALIVDAATKGI